ncbi:hypothetical protein C9928_07295, partial [Pseudidiomarina aestuarii]
MISPTRILVIFILISVTAVSFKVSAESPSNPEAQAKNYEIEIGQTFLIHVEEGSDVVVGSEQLLQAQLIQNNQLVISGLAPGHSEILLLAPNRAPQTIRVHIQAPINRRLHADLEQLQANFPELIVEHDGDVILLRGDLDSSAQEHFDHLEQDYPEVMNRIRWRQAQQVPMIELAVQIAE